MTDQPTGAASLNEPAPAALPPGDTGVTAQLSARVEQRPELAVGGAFAGGLILGLLLKRLARQ